MTKTGAWLALSVVIVVIDQLTKYAVARTFAVGEAIAVTPFLNLVLLSNPAAAVSSLSARAGGHGGLFIARGLGGVVWIGGLLHKPPRQRLFPLALSLVLAGAVGNVIDRILFGAVIDFADFHAWGRHWPAFNVAD